MQLYADDYQQWLPPIQEQIPGGGDETSWRSYLFKYLGRSAKTYDCPVEKAEVYASGKPSNSKTPSPWVIGQPVPGEIDIPSGIGAVNVHWLAGGAPPPFGRPAGYENNVCRTSAIEAPSQAIFFGDGHSDVFGVWPSDRWWIWKEVGNANSPGFNRLAQGDKGAVRHSRRSNYALADGSGMLLDPGRISCNATECWWSVKADPHLPRNPGPDDAHDRAKLILIVVLLAVAGFQAWRWYGAKRRVGKGLLLRYQRTEALRRPAQRGAPDSRGQRYAD